MRIYQMMLLFISFNLSTLYAQENNLTRIEGSLIQTSDEVYTNDTGEIFAKTFYVYFKDKFIKNNEKKTSIKSIDIEDKYSILSSNIEQLENDHGLVGFERTHPNFDPNNAFRINKKGETVHIHDRSMYYKIVFDDLKSLNFVKRKLGNENIQSIEAPSVIYLTSNDPNDPYYENQWVHKLIQSSKVFEITQGDPNIIIGISDAWTSSSAGGVHEDLDGRVIAYDDGKWVSPTSSHGPRVALIAAATNNNNKGIASLGGNMKVVSGDGGLQLDWFVDLPASQLPDVINMSWTQSYSTTTKNHIEDLLNLGVVLVTGSVNDLWWDPYNNGIPYWPEQAVLGQPYIPYPSGYIFTSGKQVISVTATQLTDDHWNFDPLEPAIDPFIYEERFSFQDLGTPDEFIFNYGLSNDPINDPDEAFTDLAAPAGWIFTARGEYSTENTSQNEYRAGGGATSEAAPLVTSVIAMMLSVNPNLSVIEIYDILTETANYDDIVVPPSSVTNTLPDGRKYNKYVGFGRIDAYEAVKHALPEPDSYTISSNTSINSSIRLKNDLTVQAGAALTIAPNTVIMIDPGVSINVYGELDVNAGKFMPFSGSWNGITFQSGSDGEIANSSITGVHSFGGAAINVYTNNHIEIHGNSITNITGAASGILFSNASDGYAYENHIENTSSYGIYAYNSSVRAFNNFIKGHSSAGVYSTGSSNVLFSAVTSPYYEGENTIVGGKYGLQIGSSSTLHAGNSSSFASQNRIANQSGSGWAHIYSTSYYTNYAQYNYFKPYNGGGGSAPTVSGWGSVTTTPYLTTDPDPGVGFKRMVNQDEPIVFSSLDEEKLYEALELKLQSDFEAAANLFEELVKQSNSIHIVEQSLHELAWINIGVKDSDLLNRFYNLEQDLLGTQFEFDYQLEKARVQYANKELGLALDLIESVMEFVDEIDPQKLKNATILAAHIAADLGDSEKAIYLMEQASSYKTKSLDEFMLLELQNYIETKDGSPRHTEPEFNEFDTPTTVSLDNYPNPFNPTTNIRFNIPSDGHVELVVFDVLGRKVAELVNEFRTQGPHTISFDASSLSSGIYLYQLTVGSDITTKQMTLIK